LDGVCFFFSSRRRHTRSKRDWSSDVCSSDLHAVRLAFKEGAKNIKVMSTGGIMSATDQVDDTELSLEELTMAVKEAHSKHMTVRSEERRVGKECRDRGVTEE